MSSKNNFVVRTMIRPEVDWAVQMAAVEGWNPGLHDAECFYRTDPKGFLVGLLDGKPIGCISAVSYQGQFGFIGFYVVLPEYRGKGYGIQIWKTALARLKGHNIGLDGVPDQITNYMKSGFTLYSSNYRFENIAAGAPAERDSGIVSAGEVSFESICQYDRQCFPADRRTFLEAWLHMPASTSLACLEKGQLQGYGVIRRCGKGYKAGPLFADDEIIAERLYRRMLSGVEKNSLLYLDVPETNLAAMALAKKYNMKQVFFTARMYSRGKPDMAVNKVFGVTTFELG
jgi:GNAT superfamily N-acetyltransferase